MDDAAFFWISVLFVLLLIEWWRRRRHDRQSDQRWQQLTQRVFALEQQVLKTIKELSALQAAHAPGEVEEGERAGAAAPREAARAETPPAALPERFLQAPRQRAPVAPAIPPTVRAQESGQPPAPAAKPPSVAAAGGLPPAVAPPGVRPPTFPTAAPPGAGLKERAKSLLNFEEALGTNWLNKLGVIILVIGVALFLAYQLRQVGPGGKILAGYAVSLAMLGGGVFFEPRERWRILARAGLGGGWALAFFTTYAMYHVQASKVLESQAADLLLLLLVAAAMVVHTLKFKSQVVTGLAFLLAFSTVTISHVNAYSLAASAILALGLVVVVGRMRWFELEVFGLLATYLNHWFWLRPIVERFGRHHPFPELTASTALLIFYWLIFRLSYIFRRVDADEEENVSTVAAILNTFLFHGVIAYQAAHPELAFSFLFSVGTAEMVLGQWSVTRRRRAAFSVLSTVGATLLVAAFAYRYSGGQLSVVWLLEAEAFLLAGIFRRERLFRWFGTLATFLVAGHLAFHDAVEFLHERDRIGADFRNPRLAVLFAVAALVFYFNAHGLPRAWRDTFEGQWEKRSLRAHSYLASVMALLAVWAVTDEPWMAVGWTALALALAAAGFHLKARDLSIQATFLALLGFFRVIFVNFAATQGLHHLSGRSVTTTLLASALLYACSPWAKVFESGAARHIPAAYTWAGSFVVALLIWYQLNEVSVAVGWALLGLALFELGVGRRAASLRYQGYVALGSSFIRMFFVNLSAEGVPGQLSPRFYTTVPLALVFFYVYWRLEGNLDEVLARDRRLKGAALHAWLGSITLAALVRFEAPPDGVAAFWAALVLALIAFAWKTGKRLFLHQGLLLGFGVFFRAVFHNLYERSYFPPPSIWHGSWFNVGAAVALLLAALPFAFRLRGEPAASAAKPPRWMQRFFSAFGRRPEQVLYFPAFVLLTALLAVELPKGLLTVGWGMEAVSAFLFALWVGQRSYRLSGLGLLLLCVAKIVFRDVWGLTPRDRYLTFIALGIALLGVSFLYTRYRETLREYL